MADKDTELKYLKNRNKSTMSYPNAAYEVLKITKNYMHSNEILKEAISRKLLVQSKSKRPQATMFSSMYLENKRRKEQDKKPRFLQLKKSIWGLMEWEKK